MGSQFGQSPCWTTLPWRDHLKAHSLRSGLALAGTNSCLKDSSLPVEAEDGILNAEGVSCVPIECGG